MKRQITLTVLLAVILLSFSPDQEAETAVDSQFESFIDTAFETNDLEMAVLILINDNRFPVSDVIEKARQMGFGFTRIIDALIDTNLSCEQVMIGALMNGSPPSALFDSIKIREKNGYTPGLILEFLVRELRFMERTEEELGGKNYNRGIWEANLEIVILVCKSMMEDKNFSQFDVMTHLCLAEAGNKLIDEFVKRFDVPPATAFKACPEHARYGHAYTSRNIPHKAYIVIGVDNLTIGDNAGRGKGVISPKRP